VIYYRLGVWVSGQRQSLKKMTHERKQRLDDIGFVWEVYAAHWEECFSKLLEFKETEGHFRVPRGLEMDGYKVGKWVSALRTTKDDISPIYKKRLDDIEFTWDPLADAWEEGFKKLLQFKEIEGHCKVPRGLKMDGHKVGKWVSTQRQRKEDQSPERKQRLDSIGFIWDFSKDKT
jgi:hypothetical protein